MPPQNLPADNHVVRHCSNRHLIRDENQIVIGVFADALSLRPREGYLSTSWLEYFAGNRQQQLCATRDILAQAGREVRPKHGLAVLHIGTIIENGDKRAARIRVLHEPKSINKAYSAIRGLPREDFDLLELLAAEACIETVEVATLG